MKLNNRTTPSAAAATSLLRRCVALSLLMLCVLSGAPSVAQQSPSPSGTVNINTADLAALQLLPRVGPAVAQRIVDHREQSGKFRQKSDLLLVRGIGEATFDRLEPFVALEGETTLREKVPSPRKSPATDAQPEVSGQANDG